MANLNPDHYPLSTAFITPSNFSLISIENQAEITAPQQISLEKKPINPDHDKRKKEDLSNSIQEFEWINYLCEKKEINYVIDFLNKNDPSLINFKGLDLQELEDVAIINVPKEFQSVAQDQYKRLLRFGGLDSNDNIGKKSGALEKEHYNDKLNDFYDLQDPWIDNEDDGAVDQNNEGKKENKKMAIPEVYYKDFYANKCNLVDFLKTPGYIDRLKLLESFDLLLENNEKEFPEKKRKSEKERRFGELGEKRPNLKKNAKKKVKPNSEVEFLNPYAMNNNPFMSFPDANLSNNFVVAANMKFNPFLYNKNLINPNNNLLNNLPSGLINDQFLEKLKNEQNIPSYLDMNNMGSLGVDLLSMIFNNNANAMPTGTGFNLPQNNDFQLDLNMNNNMCLEENQNKKKNLKKKNKNVDGNDAFPNSENKNYIEIIENEDSPKNK